MIIVRVEMWPDGDEARSRPLGRCLIANDGKGSDYTGHYDFTLMGKCRTLRQGHVADFPRRRKDVWSLLARVLKEAGK